MADSKAAAAEKAEQARLETYGATLVTAIDDLLENVGVVTLSVDHPAKSVEVTAIDPATDEEYSYDHELYAAGSLTVTIAPAV